MNLIGCLMVLLLLFYSLICVCSPYVKFSPLVLFTVCSAITFHHSALISSSVNSSFRYQTWGFFLDFWFGQNSIPISFGVFSWVRSIKVCIFSFAMPSVKEGKVHWQWEFNKNNKSKITVVSSHWRGKNAFFFY